MKRLVITFSVTAAIVGVAAGCSRDSGNRIPTGAELKGTWNQTGAGYEGGVLDTDLDRKIVITAADGQGFTGFKEHSKPGATAQKETLNGVVGVDGDILMTDDDGFFRGRLVDGKIQGQYAEVGKDSAALNIVLEKQPTA